MGQSPSSAAKKLTIDLPSTAQIPDVLLRDGHYLRYVLAGTLYAHGKLSGKEARSLTGDSRRDLEENMARYGFPLMLVEVVGEDFPLE